MKQQIIYVLMAIIMMFHAQAARAYVWPLSMIFNPKVMDYQVSFENIDATLATELNLETLAREATDPKNPPQDAESLRIVSGVMSDRVRAKLAATGYYDAAVRAYLKDTAEDDTPHLIFHVTEGKAYSIVQQEIKWKSAPLTLDEKIASLILPAPATSVVVLDHKDSLEKHLEKEFCLLSYAVEPKLLLSKQDGEALLRTNITHGGSANFGDISFTGDDSISKDILMKSVSWKQGECFSQQKLDKAQTSLLQTQLIASANVSVAEQANAEGEVPVTINIKERPHRTVTAGSSFGTDQGVGVSAGWEHRNFTGKADRLKVDALWSQLNAQLIGRYTIPYFMRDDQNFSLAGTIGQETTDTFDATYASILANIDRSIGKYLIVGAGGGFRYSSVKEQGLPTEQYGLLFFPVYTQWDSRDSATDSRKGIYARASIAPYRDMTGQDVAFTQFQGEAKTYLTEEEWLWQPTLALRAVYGQINGADTQDVPADLRFYSGGGGSVRGYNFRAIGPIDNEGNPSGGTILTELTSEIRVRFTDTIGAVAFLDAGTVYNATAPDFSEDLFMAAGLGARYYSPIGPIRFDVGIPLDDVQDATPFGVYISIGQAF
jgi:translocation and assembly module TamA